MQEQLNFLFAAYQWNRAAHLPHVETLVALPELGSMPYEKADPEEEANWSCRAYASFASFNCRARSGYPVIQRTNHSEMLRMKRWQKICMPTTCAAALTLIDN